MQNFFTLELNRAVVVWRRMTSLGGLACAAGVLRSGSDILQKKICDGILLIWSNKLILFTKLFAQMGCKSRDKSNDAN